MRAATGVVQSIGVLWFPITVEAQTGQDSNRKKHLQAEARSAGDCQTCNKHKARSSSFLALSLSIKYTSSLAILILIEVHGIAEVCVALEKVDLAHFVRVGPVYLKMNNPLRTSIT